VMITRRHGVKPADTTDRAREIAKELLAATPDGLTPEEED
jgi:hypothetical protein